MVSALFFLMNSLEQISSAWVYVLYWSSLLGNITQIKTLIQNQFNDFEASKVRVGDY